MNTFETIIFKPLVLKVNVWNILPHPPPFSDSAYLDDRRYFLTKQYFDILKIYYYKQTFSNTSICIVPRLGILQSVDVSNFTFTTILDLHIACYCLSNYLQKNDQTFFLKILKERNVDCCLNDFVFILLHIHKFKKRINEKKS